MNASGGKRKRQTSWFPRATELSVIFTEDRRQVLTNVSTGSTPFLFQACRMISGNKSSFLRYSWHAAFYWPPLSRLRWQGETWQAISFQNHRFRSWEGTVAGRGAGSGGECANWFAVRRMPMYGPGATAGIPAFPEWHTASHQVQLRINVAPY